MAYQFSRKGCFKCGNLGHIAENCTSEQRLCYNCRQPGHESSACAAPRSVASKQCYSCGGVGHIQAECPSLRVQGGSGNQKCYNCGRFGHIARVCPASMADVTVVEDRIIWRGTVSRPPEPWFRTGYPPGPMSMSIRTKPVISVDKRDTSQGNAVTMQSLLDDV
ncbi:hypothetical protein PISMIDRAFT_304033 [Pisolithus microcarpus 441]|uniref:Unplaced genomic scaffold scaffold_2, whole genome shotgun sequence n=1 Tax=Pisolithus microcarpus 441 TaxID=765257 RepID=A0A0D0A899_9AGAM|nr:hypothetical protein PISMIDRAFT_304033 [Pisolithus microcarpus 441]